MHFLIQCWSKIATVRCKNKDAGLIENGVISAFCAAHCIIDMAMVSICLCVVLSLLECQRHTGEFVFETLYWIDDAGHPKLPRSYLLWNSFYS